jgi:hypothetical protein
MKSLLSLKVILRKGVENMPRYFNTAKYSSKPLLFLDVSSVLNFDSLVTPRNLNPLPWNDILSVRQIFGDNKLEFSGNLIEKVNDLSEYCEVKWLANWNKKIASNLAQIVGLKSFEFVEPYCGQKIFNERQNFLLNNSCKRSLYIKQMASIPSDRPVIWIDRDIDYWKQTTALILSDYSMALKSKNKQHFLEHKEHLIKSGVAIDREWLHQKLIYSRQNTLFMCPENMISGSQIKELETLLKGEKSEHNEQNVSETDHFLSCNTIPNKKIEAGKLILSNL